MRIICTVYFYLAIYYINLYLNEFILFTLELPYHYY